MNMVTKWLMMIMMKWLIGTTIMLLQLKSLEDLMENNSMEIGVQLGFGLAVMSFFFSLSFVGLVVVPFFIKVVWWRETCVCTD